MIIVKSYFKFGVLIFVKNFIVEIIIIIKGVMFNVVFDILFSVLGDIIMFYFRSFGFYIVWLEILLILK